MFDSPESLASATPDRCLEGPHTDLDMPHAVAVASDDDLLFVANTGNGYNTGSILIWEDASTVYSSNVAADEAEHELGTPLVHPWAGLLDAGP